MVNWDWEDAGCKLQVIIGKLILEIGASQVEGGTFQVVFGIVYC